MSSPSIMTLALGALLGCTSAPDIRGIDMADGSSPALADSLLSMVDSLLLIHQRIPDTALLGRVFPPSDSLLYVEGSAIQLFRGDSLARRTMRAHAGVRDIHARAPVRHIRLLGRDGAEITVLWEVEVVDTAGVRHPWRGPITLGLARRGNRWTVRTYRE